MHDITVCFAGLYCGLFLLPGGREKESGRNMAGAGESTDKKVPARKKKKKAVVSAVVKANNRGICSSIRDLQTEHYDRFFFCLFCFFTVGH